MGQLNTEAGNEHGHCTEIPVHVIETNCAQQPVPQLRDCKPGQFVVVETGRLKGLLLFITNKQAITLDGSNRAWEMNGITQILTDFVRPMRRGEHLTIKIGRD